MTSNGNVIETKRKEEMYFHPTQALPSFASHPFNQPISHRLNSLLIPKKQATFKNIQGKLIFSLVCALWVRRIPSAHIINLASEGSAEWVLFRAFTVFHLIFCCVFFRLFFPAFLLSFFSIIFCVFFRLFSDLLQTAVHSPCAPHVIYTILFLFHLH